MSGLAICAAGWGLLKYRKSIVFIADINVSTAKWV
jgi:hypothetical protein